MEKKAVLATTLMLLLVSMLTLASSTQSSRSIEEPPIVEWSKTYGGGGNDYAYSLVQTSDGGYALAGSGFADLVKTDASGNVQMSKAYGVSASCVIQASDGGYALACSGSANFLKTDASGNMQISKAYGGSASCIVQASDGGYALAGVLGNDFWLVKIDSVGNMQWSQTYGGTNEESAYSVVHTSDGGYALVGYVWANGRDCWLVKTDANGNEQWNKTIEENVSGRFEGRSIVQTGDGGYAIAVDTYTGARFGDFWLVKTDSSGNQQWSKTFDGGAGDYSFDVVQTSDGGYALAGERGGGPWSLPGYGDFWLVKTDVNGNHQWNISLGGSGYDQAYSLVQTSDGGFALAGYTRSYGAGAADFWLVKLSPPPPQEIEVALDLEPNTLNLKANGRWITAYTQLPEDYSASDIDATTVLLNGTVAPVLDPKYDFVTNSSEYFVDSNNDGTLERMVKFDRASLASWIYQSAGMRHEVSLTITGELTDGTPFEGTATIFVFWEGHRSPFKR